MDTPVPELAEGTYLFVALAHAAATFVNFAYAEFHSYSSFQLLVLHSPFFLRWPFRFLRQERLGKGFAKVSFLRRHAHELTLHQYKPEAQAKVVKLVQMKRRIVAQIFSYEPQH
ncbi:MAG: hypothetical protein DWH95_11555 [Planctomycetota bacterium]|nr:MAG: hypothetical protein DWH95_11555 [Planctomycetota bacterium]